jgi:group I intron endonuclease
MKTGIYHITNNKTSKVYIGSSVDIDIRINSHFSSLKAGVHGNKKLQEDFNTYGIDNFSSDILMICPEDFLIEMENHFIFKFDNTYNVRKAHVGRYKRVKKSKVKKPYAVKVDKEILDDIKKVAEKQHRSVNNTIEIALIEYAKNNS